MAQPSGGSVSASGNPLIDGLLQGSSWTFQAGPRVITYSFNSTGYGGSWTQPLIDGANAAYAAIEAICNVDFQQISSGTYVWQSNADIAMGLSGSRQAEQWDTIGYANFPDPGENDLARADYSELFGQTFTSTTYAKPEGDILIDNYDVAYDYMAADGLGLTVFLHEILHALGLKHPHDDGGTGMPTFAQLGISNLDVDQYTVMSYNFEFPYYDIGNPSTPMVLDILALQYIYGANMTYRTGDDIYTFEYGKCYAIWDAGGNDTISAIYYSSGITLDLDAGSTNIDNDSYSTVGIAFGVTIENAHGSALTDVIQGNSADNNIWGGGGSDELSGDDGNDRIYGDSDSPSLPDDSNDRLDGGGGADYLWGGDGEGGDLLDGGTGADTLEGGAGGDIYSVDNLADQIIEIAGGGLDLVFSSIDFSLKDKALENLTLTGAAAINGTGNNDNNTIVGNDGNNVLTGSAGDDILSDKNSTDDDLLVGGTGNDTYSITSLNDHVLELADEGLDTLRVYLQIYTLDDNFEFLNFVDQNGIVGNGNALDNWITGSFGNDIIDGGAGGDRMAGGAGSDIYYLDNRYDRIEGELTSSGGGVDEVRMTASNDIVGCEGIEIFTLLGSANLNAYGSWSNNEIFGNAGANYLSGGLGDDRITFGNKDYASGDHDRDSYTFVANYVGGVKEAAIVTNFEYLETLTFSTILPLAGAASPILWPIALGDGSTTLLNQLEYFSNGFDTFLSFGLDDIAGADFTITLQNVVKAADLKAMANGNTVTIYNMDVPNIGPTAIILDTKSMIISEDTAVGTVIGKLSAIDPDNSGPITFSSLDGTFGDFKIINGDTLVLAKPLDADGPGDVAWANIQVQDAEGAWYSESFKFQIGNVNDNAPVITSGYGMDTYVTAHLENDLIFMSVTATDLDKNSALSYAVTGGADKAFFAFDSVGNLSFIKAPDFEAPADTDHNNVYEVTIEVSDGKFTDSQNLVISILDEAGVIIKGTAGRDYYNDSYATEDGDQMFGFAGNDTLMTEGGNDLLDGGTGADAMYGGNGDDTYIVDNVGDETLGEYLTNGFDTVKASVSYRLSGGMETLILMGTAANGTGNELNNKLTGNASANVLDGQNGADIMAGGNGSDIYIVDNAADVVVETSAAGGTDLVKCDISYVLGNNVENLTLGGLFNPAIDGTGNELKNAIVGNAGDNRLDGRAGNDTLTGGKGSDTYIVDAIGDVVNETVAIGGGIDTVESAVNFSLSTRANIENLTLTGPAANATGNTLANILTGNSLANILDGGTGKDTMRGGSGNDFYVVDNVGDVVEELGSDSGDEVKSATVRFTAIAGIEHYTYLGTAAWAFVATSADNKIAGGAGADQLNGANGNDTLFGNAGNDLLIGGLGDDWLDGGLGNDTMKGGAGKDTYVVNAAGDKIDEEGNADNGDLVRSSVTINLTTLGAGLIEDTILLGATAINATGNSSLNHLIGNNSANILDGKGGADFLEGGKGADTYVVDSLGDQVIESLAGAAGGVDLVKSSVTYTLGANFEKLTLTEAGSIGGFGNTLNNTLLGNIGANRLDGGAGNDTMTGGKGSDIYVVDAAGDVVSETIAAGGGIDTVESSVTFTLATRVNVENLELTGAGNINGTGNALANLIEGNAGNNKIDGGSGNDVLFGLGGNDTILGGLGNDTIIGGLGADQLNGGSGRNFFDFDTLQEAGDTITGFVKGAAGDVLDLRDLLDSVGYAGTTPITDFLSFEQSSGNTIVKFDADGLGAGGPTTLVTLLNVGLTADDANNILV